jgi:hypothetical protein
LIENKKPESGTWKRSFETVNLLDIERPFSRPLPKLFNKFRVKEWQSFLVQDERFILEATLSNVKLFRWAQVFVYDKENDEKLWFRKMLPFGGWNLPESLSNASVDSKSYGFFFRIHDWLDAGTIKVDLDVEANSYRPSFTAHLEYEIDEDRFDPLAVNLLFSEKRCMYAYKALTPVRGDIVFHGKHLSLDAEKTAGLFCDFKGYYPYRMHSVWCNGLGFAGNKRYGFSIAENQTRETYKNNENALWVDGKLTPLPPVRITQPNGLFSDWIIQDMEGMIDLVFTPKEPIVNEIDLIFTKVEYNIPLGYFNGMLVTSEEERIHVRNLWGFGQKLFMRV